MLSWILNKSELWRCEFDKTGITHPHRLFATWNRGRLGGTIAAKYLTTVATMVLAKCQGKFFRTTRTVGYDRVVGPFTTLDFRNFYL